MRNMRNMRNMTNNIPVGIVKKIFVCCPGGSVTGGPELLHQLVDALRKIGHDAFITYYPFNIAHGKPAEYSNYDCPIAQVEDDNTSLVIIPEVITSAAKKFKKSRIAIWWLSVDNYYQRKAQSRLVDLWRMVASLWRSRIPLRSMSKFLHFTQSAYARDFLKDHNLSSHMLTDYLNLEHINEKQANLIRDNVVVYNPKKGAKITQMIINKYPSINFVPIEKMTRTEVRELLSSAKIYMDFGHHPGKDRLPREAAMAGCCVITGRQGSARNEEDVPIPSKYKLRDNEFNFSKEYIGLVESIFKDYELHSKNYEEYRRIIASDHELFRRQVANIFGKKEMIGLSQLS